MKIEFSDHAKERNRKRRIPKMRILETAKHPEEIKIGVKSREIRRKIFGNKILEVVTVYENNRLIIITAYYVEANYENKIRHKN